MIPKSQICIGVRIVENDPEEQAPFLIKGKSSPSRKPEKERWTTLSASGWMTNP